MQINFKKILSFSNYHIFQVKHDCNTGQCILFGMMSFVLMIRLKGIYCGSCSPTYPIMNIKMAFGERTKTVGILKILKRFSMLNVTQ